jgi:hypothetical protein
MTWGKSIILAFVLFAAFMAILVTVCLRQDVSLVANEYYAEELVFQQQIDRISNTNELKQLPRITLDGDTLTLSFKGFPVVEKGQLQLFRPSNPAFDRLFEFRRIHDTFRSFSTKGLIKGMYRARMQWTMQGKEFFFEQIIYL